jgi:hypothetical protein
MPRFRTMQEFVRQHRRGVTVGVMATAIVLVVIAGFFVVTLMNGNQPAADEPSLSPSMSAWATTSPPSPRPIPSPSASEPAPSTINGPILATVLVDHLRMRDEAGLDGTPVASLNAGEVVQVEEGPTRADGMDWYLVWVDPERNGWVAAGDADDPLLELHYVMPTNLPATIAGVAAGDAGFVAWGTEAGRSDRVARVVILFSAQGTEWERATLPNEMTHTIVDIAWGPAGWILIASNDTNERPAPFWHSTDGLNWTQLPDFRRDGMVPTALVGSDIGYAMEVRDDTSGTSEATVYFSTDGAAWQRTGGYPEGTYGGSTIGIPHGFLVLISDPERTRVFQNTNGTRWDEVGDGLPESANFEPQVATIGDHVVAVVAAFDTGEQSIWRARVGGDAGLSWERMTGAEATVAGDVVIRLASSGSALLAYGYSLPGAAPRLWRSRDGASWSRIDDTGPFDGGDTLVAGGRSGFVAIGAAITTAGSNPVLWRSGDGERWRPESDPILGIVRSPLVGACPALPTTHVDWAVMPASVGVQCFGDQPMTFRTFLTEGGGCGGAYPGTFKPAWLAPPFAAGAFIFTPNEATSGGCGSAARHPDLENPADPQQWVMVTGHYDDPAASTCRYLPDPAYPVGFGSSAEVVWGCRDKFVATAVVPAD